MSWWRHIIRGCFKLPHLGPHPGNVMMVVLLILALAAGLKIHQEVLCTWLVLLIYGPVYLAGAYRRSMIDYALSLNLDTARKNSQTTAHREQ